MALRGARKKAREGVRRKAIVHSADLQVGHMNDLRTMPQ
jgi:hypothetical protein